MGKTGAYGMYELVNYFDVWGNEKDGWDINNQCVEFSGLQVADSATEKDLLRYLESIGFLTTSDMRRVMADMSDRDAIEVYQRKGMRPLCGLRRIQA